MSELNINLYTYNSSPTSKEAELSIQKQLETIEAQWDETDPQIIEAAREFIKEDITTEEEKK